ncbi:WSC domain-containing protein 1, partial [Hyalella azteca]|uniref:WSC domain-containing protein 1 n=1 Tax=Hyalella azteca TaxID=294128 RepID=A0A8B7P5X3_HYAAZ
MQVFMRKTFLKTICVIFFTSAFLIFALRITRPAETNNPLIGINAQQLRWNYSGGEFLGLPEHPPFQQDLQSPISAHPWPNDTTCSRFETRLGVDIPRVYLISFPRSGNTWTRYLVEGATGIFTGSVYVDQKLYNLGYLGEEQNITSNTTLLIKDHLTGGKPAPRDGPIILLIRDPR